MSTIDQIALDTVQAIAGIDPDKLKGGKGQAMAQAQCLVIDAMKQAGAPDMRPIALKKLSQMGATVHGVLAKNEVGRWVAVSEAGRVMWLDNFEGQSSSAQGEPSSGVPEGYRGKLEQLVLTAYYSTDEEDKTVNADDLRAGIDRLMAILTAAPTPEAGQSGGEPDWSESVTLDSEAWKNPLLNKNDRLQIADGAVAWRDEIIRNLRGANITHPHTNQPDSEQGGEWVRCDERLPTEADGNLIWSHDQKRGSVELCSWAWSHSLFKHGYITHWQPTGLTRPQPPKSKEGES